LQKPFNQRRFLIYSEKTPEEPEPVKRTVTGLSLIAALLLSATAIAMIVNTVVANPVCLIYGYFPLEPVMTPPTITLDSPVQNQVYDSSDLWLNFTITKPEAWFVYDVARDENGTSKTLTVGRITSVYYILDNGEPQNVTVNDGGLPSEFSIEIFPNRILNFSTRLALPGGVHSVKVGFEANSYYYTGWGVLDPGLRSVVVNGSSDTIHFSVADSFLTALVVASIASVAVIGIVLLVYFKKRNH